MAVSDYSTNPGSNTSISGINIGEGCPPGNVNNALRTIMADVASGIVDGSFVTGDYQPLDATLTALAGTSPIADQLIYANGTDTFTTAALTAFARTILAAADQSAARTALGALGVVDQSLAQNGGYRVYSDGFKETWGYVDVAGNSSGSYTVPYTHTTWIHPTIGVRIQSGNTGQNDNAGISSTWSSALSSITLYNAEDFTVRIYVATRGV